MGKRKMLSLICICVLMLMGYTIYFLLPKLITEVGHPFLRPFSQHHVKAYKTYAEDGYPGLDLSIVNEDGLLQKGYLTYSRLDSVRATILLIHGIRSTKERFIRQSQRLADAGYQSIAIDLRAHGDSQGRYCTFGHRERKDISRFIDTLLALQPEGRPVGMWGTSLGGAVTMQVMAKDERVHFGIVESAFSDMFVVTADYGRHYLGWNAPQLNHFLVRRAGHIADFDPHDVAPAHIAPLIRQPIRYVHGSSDTKVPLYHGQANLSATNSRDKQLIEIRGAGHDDVWKVGGDTLRSALFEFIDEMTLQAYLSRGEDKGREHTPHTSD